MTFLFASEIDPGPNLAALLAFFACLCGVYLLGQGLLSWRRRPALQLASVSTIRDIHPGLAEISGLAEGPHTMIAAISGKECFFYRTTIWRQDSAKSGEWKKAVEETFCLPFFLADRTGRILLDPRGAEIDFPRDVYEEYGKTLLSTHTDIPKRLEDFLARHNVAAGAAIRIEEHLIPPESQVFARGTIAKNKDGIDLSSTPLNLVKGGYLPVVLSEPAEVLVVQADPPLSVPTKASSNGTSNGAGPTTIGPEVIRLSTSSPSELSPQVTMQSRLAAALRRANASSNETWGMALPETQEPPAADQTVAATAAPTNGEGSQSSTKPATEIHAKQALAAMANMASISPPPPSPRPSRKASAKHPPALILGKDAGGSRLTLSTQSWTKASETSGMAAALMIVGPAITLGGVYYLLITFGWL